jgi:hypothetical protein
MNGIIWYHIILRRKIENSIEQVSNVKVGKIIFIREVYNSHA